MKRAGNLMVQIAAMDNLREAFLLVQRGKQLKAETIRFRENLHEELLSLHRQLLDGSYRQGDYRRFTVYDPKERTICALPLRDRVVQHAMMRICHPLFERYQCSCSFASRPERGTYKAIDKAQQHSRQHQWWLKLDVRKFFDSIDHEKLRELLRRIVKDPLLLSYWDMTIDSYETTPGRGLPIGNLTSQYWANHYLAVADHYALEQLHAGSMVRYMDDVAFWANDRQELLMTARTYSDFVRKELKLELHPTVLNHTRMGMPFLGYVIYPRELRLCQRSRHRYNKRSRLLEQLAAQGVICEDECRQRLSAMLSFVEKANSAAFLRRTRMLPQGLQPRAARRQLEQQRHELPLCQSEQQHADEPEQQQRVPAGPPAQPLSDKRGRTGGISRPCSNDRTAAWQMTGNVYTCHHRTSVSKPGMELPAESRRTVFSKRFFAGRVTSALRGASTDIET